MTDRLVVDAWIQWMKFKRWDFFVTLNFNCNSNIIAARTHFRRFCQRLDRRVLGPGWARDISRRTEIVAVPEHMSSNFHFHCLVRQRGNFALPEGRFQKHIAVCWGGVIGSGSCDVRPVGDSGRRAAYMAKELWKKENYEAFLISPEAPSSASSTRATSESAISLDHRILRAGPQSEFAQIRADSRLSTEKTRPVSGAIPLHMEVNMSRKKTTAPAAKASRYFDRKRRKIARYLQRRAGIERSRRVICAVEHVARRLNGSRWWREQFDFIADRAGVSPTRAGCGLHLRLMKVLGVVVPGSTMKRWSDQVTQCLTQFDSSEQARDFLLEKGPMSLLRRQDPSETHRRRRPIEIRRESRRSRKIKIVRHAPAERKVTIDRERTSRRKIVIRRGPS